MGHSAETNNMRKSDDILGMTIIIHNILIQYSPYNRLPCFMGLMNELCKQKSTSKIDALFEGAFFHFSRSNYRLSVIFLSLYAGYQCYLCRINHQ
jgi:hypothetical protein